MSNYTAKDLETLRLQAQKIGEALRVRQEAQEQRYRQQLAAADEQREKALRQAYVSQQQALRQLPAQLAGMGIGGGAAESSVVQLRRQYGSQRSAIRADWADAYRSLLQQKLKNDEQLQQERTKNEADYLGAYSALQAQLEKQLQAQAERQQRAAAKQQPAVQPTVQPSVRTGTTRKAGSGVSAALRKKELFN